MSGKITNRLMIIAACIIMVMSFSKMCEGWPGKFTDFIISPHGGTTNSVFKLTFTAEPDEKGLFWGDVYDNNGTPAAMPGWSLVLTDSATGQEYTIKLPHLGRIRYPSDPPDDPGH